jgi:hypothetical protein
MAASAGAKTDSGSSCPATGQGRYQPRAPTLGRWPMNPSTSATMLPMRTSQAPMPKRLNVSPAAR